MSGVFQLVGGAADPIAIKLDTTSPVPIAEAIAGNARVMVPWFRCTALDATTPALEIYVQKTDGTKAYIRPSQNMTDKQSLLFEEGYVLLPGWALYVKAGTADKIDVTGLALLGDGNA